MKKSLLFSLLIISYFFGNATVSPVIEERALPQLESIFSSKNFLINLPHPSQIYTNFQDSFILFDPSQHHFQLIDSTNPYGFLDDMQDLKNSFTSEEVSNINKARAALTAIKDGARFVQKFDGSSIVDLPRGISNDFGDTKVTIAISALRVYPTHTALEVFVEIDRKDWPLPLLFYAPEITFTLNGGISGISSVGLLGNIAIPIEEGKSIVVFNRALYDPITRSFTEGTYVDFDCDGFKKMGLKGQLHFSREWALPVMPNGKLHPTNRVVANFDTEISNPNDLIFDISMDEFVLPGADRIAWTISNAIIDCSQSEKRFDFPVGSFNYDPTINGTGYLPNNEAWQGVFVREFGIRWVDTIALETKTSTIGIQGFDIVIDHNGFSGFVAVTGLLPLDKGDLDGWDFSIDELGVEVLMNQPSYFEFGGVLVVPLLKKDESDTESNNLDQLAYGGDFDFINRKYGLNVGLAEDKEFDVKMFKGKAVIKATSTLRLEYRADEGFGIEAILHGQFGIQNAKIGKKKLTLPSVAFEGLHIASQKDYIRNIGIWGLPDEIGGSFLGFGYNVDLIQLSGNKEDAEFRVIAALNFSEGQENEEEGGIYISSKGAFRLKGKIEIEDGTQKQRYNYKTLKVDMIEVIADLSSIYFYGQIIFYQDYPNWGTGFQGKVEIYISGANKNDGGAQEPNMGIAALALFGTNDMSEGESYRYFLIDILARLGDGITIPNTGMKLKGIGGGVYYHMNQLSVTQNIKDEEFDPGDPITQPDSYTQWMLDQIGVSLSGTQYIPDDSKLFGVNATIVISLEKEEAFNANITFTLQVNSNYGIDFIRIKGVTNFMAPISWTAPSCTGVSAAIEMNFIFNNNDGIDPGFYASAHVFANVAANNFSILAGNNNINNAPPQYINQMKKVCPESMIKYAGGLEVQLTKDEWFLNLGRPEKDERLKLKADLKISSFMMDTYLDIGTNIPPFPGLPPNVAELTNLFPINEAGRSTGKGFAFGASYNMNLIDLDYFVFKAHIGVEAGMDIMMKQFEPTSCVNNNNEPLGVHYWYSMGQAYAMLSAEVRILQLIIFNAGIAAALQFEGPKPFFGNGAIAGQYTTLFNKKKSFYVPFQFGKKCDSNGEMEESTTEYALINNLNPSNNAEFISPDKNILAAFNYPLDEIFSDVDNNGNPLDYQLEIDEFSLVDQQNNIIPGELKYNSYYVEFVPFNMLAHNSTFTCSLKASFINKTTGIAEVTEEKNHTFTTGPELKIIPESNIEFTYPFNGQFNYYKEQAAYTAQIKLIKGQESIFDNVSVNYFAKITSSYPAYAAYVPINYNPTTKKVIFSLPDDFLNGQSYQIQIISKHTGGGVTDTDETDTGLSSNSQPGGSNNNNNAGNNNTNSSNSNNTGPISTDTNGNIGTNSSNFLPGDLLPELEDNEFVLYTSYFRTSTYNTVESKLDSISFNDFTEKKFSTLNIPEPFGQEELEGVYNLPPSFRIEAILDSTDWYDSYKNFATHNGPINPYKTNSGRVDYQDAIMDNLSPERIEMLGEGIPTFAIDIQQNNLELFKINANNLNDWNIANQQGNLLHEAEIEANYLVDEIVWNDISYYINQSISEINWQVFLEDLSSSLNCNSLNACCLDNPDKREVIINRYNNLLSNSNDIFEGSYFVNTNYQTSCNYLIPTNIEDFELSFLTHDMQKYDLENGQYPIRLVYKHKPTDIPISSKIYHINKTDSPSN